MHDKLKRCISIILCLAMIVTAVPYIPGVLAASATDGMKAVTSNEIIEKDGINYSINRTTQYVGNRTYCVQVDISSDLSSFEHARVRTAARNGYVTIEQTGYYLIELWGGDGASGWAGVTGAIIIPLPTPNGEGASGGYVYGKVFLKKGQTLVYNIGTNGTQSAEHNDGSGGVNGDGGTHGEEGSYVVGGGGGYTAVYLFNEGEFREEYVTETTLHIPETARLSRYLMIAGGGGGGGAGIGGTLLTLADNGSPPTAPDGGAGGSVNRGGKISLLGNDYDVPGYVFPGRNGLSSGTDTTWIGIGGSNIPGPGSVTVGGQYTETTPANDWTGSQAATVQPGAGGSGNFRGGGGGSGYTGGSGGLMKGLALASHVGGGGGGSSFIAEKVNGEDVIFEGLDQNTTKYISGANNQPLGATTGGACQITYLGEADEQLYEDTLKDVTLNATVSKYFDVLDSSNSTGSAITYATSDNGTTVSAGGLSVLPASPAHTGDTARVTFYIKAKSNFMGGNVVEMVENLQLDFISPNDNKTAVTIKPEDNRVLDVVNVPLKVTNVKTKSYTTSVKGKSFAVKDLYIDDYANVRGKLADYWECDYIADISDYLIFVGDKQITTTTVAPTSTTYYDIQYTVTMKNEPDDEIEVGPSMEKDTTLTGTAIISVIEPDNAFLNELMVSGSKNLTYQDGKYDFAVNVSQTSDTIVMENSTMSTSSVGDGIWEAPCDGWYYLQAWGGNGQGSGASHVGQTTTLAHSVARRGQGGAGGYVTGYIYLEKGDTLTYNVGQSPRSGVTNSISCNKDVDGCDDTIGYYTRDGHTADSHTANTGTGQAHGTRTLGGSGGTFSKIVSGNGTTLIIAGGGGGAGGSAASASSSGTRNAEANGRTGGTNDTISTTLETDSMYNGTSGGNGTYTANYSFWGSTIEASAGSAGTAGANYRMSELLSGYDTTGTGITLPVAAEKYASQQSTSKSDKNGKIAITLVSNTESQDKYDKILGVETKVAISRYFDIQNVSLKTGDTFKTTNTVDNVDGSKTVTYLNASSEVIAQFTYRIDAASDGVSQVITITDLQYIPDPYTKTENGIYYLYYQSALEFTYSLTPKEGFLGGNDVPVLAYGQVGEGVDSEGYADNGVRIIQGEGTLNLQPNDLTDYANVEYQPNFEEYLTVQDKTIQLGQSVEKTELYTYKAPTYAADAWEDDYAYFVSPGNETYKPNQTTDYPIAIAYTPRSEGTKAIIVDKIEPQEYTLEATVFVEVPVTFNLTNLRSDGEAWVLYGTQYGCTLSPDTGYDLPDEIQVTIAGVVTDNYTYNNSLGTVTIDKEHVIGPIAITAKANVRTYSIHFIHTDSALDETEEVVKTGYTADATIDWKWLDDYVASMPEREGYEYRLIYDTVDRERPEKMPANNLWVYGSYEKEEYLLTINYVYEDGTKAAETHKSAVVYGDSYSVVSPLYPNIEKKGYMPDQLTVSGEMGAANVTVTVTYRPTNNLLYISYQKEDGTELSRVEKTLETNAAFSEVSPEIEGYTPNMAVVEGVMSGDESEIYVVVYTPNTYKLHFNVGEGVYADAIIDNDSKLVEYDNFYSYNAAEDIYDGLPTPQLAGYTFAGWYFDKEYTQQLIATDTVRLLNNETVVYAKWDRAKYKLTVKYQFLYTDGDYLPDGFDSADAVQTTLVDNVQTVEYGTDYNVMLPSLVGYSAYKNFDLTDQEKLTVLSGTMPAQNRVVVITYEINTYEIKFCDKPGENVTYSDAATASTASDSFNTEWDTVYVKHNVVPIYSNELAEPNHATREEYTYDFIGWKSSVDSVEYEGKSPSFPAATCDMSYYAMYDATENIVSVKYGSTTQYFTNVAEAVAYAETNISSSPTMAFRRNDGNGTTIDVTEDRVVLGNTYTGTSVYTFTIDLNGCTLISTQGEAAIENHHKYMPITITDAVGNGSIDVSGADDVVAIDVDARNVTINKAITINATSTNGNATAIRIGANTTTAYLYLQATIHINASASNGTATGVEGLDSAYTLYISPSMLSTIKAEGKRAIGINIKDATVSFNNTKLGMDVKASEEAIGILVSEEGSMSNGSKITDRLAVTSEGVAYGIWNKGTMSSLNMKFDVDATSDAYGLYNDGGTITVTGISTYVDFIANSQNGSGYGLYNVENGTAIGTTDTCINSGAFAGSSYGIYSSDNSIYAAGNYLYFMGADAETAMEGVVYTDYQKTDATAQFAAGYYRLAMERTLVFVTNGGSEIATITQLYDTPLSVDTTTKLGYKFINWHKTEELTSAYIIPESMPDEDLTLYAEWEIIQYQYALDTEFKDVKVIFYKNDPTNTSDTTVIKEVTLTKENPNLEIPEDPTFVYNNYLYVFSGWYTTKTTSSANYAILNGDISQFDTDNDGVVELYAGWKRSYNYQRGYSKLSTDSNPTGVTISSTHTSSYSHYMYYQIPKDGTYSISIANIANGTSSSYRNYVYIRKYVTDSLTTNSTVSKTSYYPLPKTSLSASAYTSYSLGAMKAGDVVMVQLYDYSSTYTSNMYAYVSSTPDLTDVEQYKAYSMEHIVPRTYNVEMGTVTLPIADKTEHSGERFVGWADTEDALATDRFMQITPDMVDTVPEWQNGELWQLYSQWDDARWTAYASDHRDFTDFTSTETITIDEDETLSVRFETEVEVEDAVSFKFKNGLPKDTILTLVERSGSMPKYYTYTVKNDDCMEIVATQFTEMGNSGEKFDGKSKNIILQICYTNADVDAAAEEISLFMKDEITSEAVVAYSLTKKNVVTVELDSVEVQYNESYDVTATVQSLQGKGYDNTDKVFLRISWDGETLAPGTTFKVGDNIAKVYDGEFATITLGTVADFMTGKSLTLTCDLSTMMQNEFENKAFTYEVCIAGTGTSESIVYGKNIDVIAKATQDVTITETPVLTVSDLSTRRVAQGGTLNISTITLEDTNVDQIEMYLFAMTEEGKLAYIDACATVFDSTLITIMQDGKLNAVSGTLVVNDTFETTVQATATTGKYYLKIVYGDKYAIVPIVIEE